MANIKDLIKSIDSPDSSFEDNLKTIRTMEETIEAMKAQEQQAIQDNVDLIVEAIRTIERKVADKLVEVESIVREKGEKGDKGADGRNGLPGKDGANGRDGRDGQDGKDGQDGADGVSVADANIDFDGSLIITLSSGRVINVGEVVAPDLAEKIKLVTSGGGTSQQVLDTLASLQTQIDTLIPSQTGNAGKYLTTNGTATSWATVSGSGDVVGPASATDNSLARFDGTTGKLIQNSGVTVDDSGNLTYSAGTANGVTYLNGSKVLTSGSALTFDGAVLFNTQSNGTNSWFRAKSGTVDTYFGAVTTGFGTVGFAGTFSNNDFVFYRNTSEQMRLTSTGLGIGTSSPAFKADIVGQTRSTAYIETKTVISASAINLTAGNYFTKTISGATTFTTSGTPATGNVASFVLDLTNGGSAAVTWWSGVKWASGTAPTLTASGRDVLGFFTHDGGTTWNGFVLGKAMA